MVRPARVLALLSWVLLCVSAAAQGTAAGGEVRAARAFAAAKKSGAPELYAFLKSFPKGGDLHMHLSGAVYAETFLSEAAEQGMCVDAVKLAFAAPGDGGKCAEGLLTAANAVKDQALYDRLIDSFSMKSFVPTARWSGHDQFFATFAKFGGLKGVQGQWLDEVATRAAAQNEQYLEIMNTPVFANAAALGAKIGWPAGAETSVTREQLAALRDALLAAGLRSEVEADRREFEAMDREREAIEHCGAEQAQAKGPCAVKIHYLYQVLRAFAPEQVFAQTLLGFETVAAEQATGHPRVLGVNFVQPEDARLAMRDYHLQMQMVAYLHAVYPSVRISLHAGELGFGMVPPQGTSFHVREAVELAGAERIGHGVDVLYEDHAQDLLKEMAKRHVDVEVNLTSNDGILGVKGSDHPLRAYREAHVPFSLSTDDEGVSRIDLTHEYVRAAMEQNLGYAELKVSARSSLEHSFLPGESLWAAPDDFTHRKVACARPLRNAAAPSPACAALLGRSERAAAQWELERRLMVFEALQR